MEFRDMDTKRPEGSYHDGGGGGETGGNDKRGKVKQGQINDNDCSATYTEQGKKR